MSCSYGRSSPKRLAKNAYFWILNPFQKQASPSPSMSSSASPSLSKYFMNRGSRGVSASVALICGGAGRLG